MEGFDSSAIQLELKYCERCGGLWLRPQGSDLIFCGACAKASAHILGWPRPAQGSRRLADAGSLGAFWSEGGNA